MKATKRISLKTNKETIQSYETLNIHHHQQDGHSERSLLLSRAVNDSAAHDREHGEVRDGVHDTSFKTGLLICLLSGIFSCALNTALSLASYEYRLFLCLHVLHVFMSSLSSCVYHPWSSG